MTDQITPLIMFAPCFIGAFAVLALDLLLRRRVGKRSIISSVTALATLTAVTVNNWLQASEVFSTGKPLMIQLEPSLLATTFTITRLGVFISSIALLLTILVSVYASVYMSEEDNVALFQALILLLYLAIYTITVAGDLLTFFIGWEGMSVSGYGLVAFYKHRLDSIEASIKYLLMSGIGSLTALYGIALVYGLTGTLNFEVFQKSFATFTPIGVLALLLIFVGFGVEAAVVPMHMWLPDAYPASPTPMTAMLAGIMTGLGSYAFIRVLGPVLVQPQYSSLAQPLLATAAVVTMFVGNLSALQQDDLKRLLAYSSIGQAGYILLGIAPLTVAGFSASIFQIWNHALLKGMLFLLAGIVTYQIGTRSLTEIAGLGRKNPTLATLFTAGALGMTGAPPFGLSWSELFIVLSNIAVGSPVLDAAIVLMLFNVVISIGYYFKIIKVVVFAKPSNYLSEHSVTKTPSLLFIPCCVLIGLSVITGLYPNLVYQAATDAIKGLFVGFCSLW